VRILQIPADTVKSRIFYGLRALCRTLAAQDAVASAKGIVTGQDLISGC
jgi:DNA-directed RNA polymerase specialized sigma24 family protein